MPKIIVKKDIEKEKEGFNNFLFAEQCLNRWPDARTSLLELYPQLDKRLASTETLSERKALVDAFVEQQYSLHKASLEEVVARLTSLFQDKAEVILNNLSTIMDYKIPENTYFISPSLFPSSTCGRGFIFLSVVAEINGKGTAPYADIAIHEASHIIWNEKIEEVYERLGFRYSSKKHSKNQGFKPGRGNKRYLVNEAAHEDLKETFAPIIIRCPEFDGIRESERLKYANSQQQLLNVEYAGEIYNFVDFFDRIFKTERSKGTPFDDITGMSVQISYSIQEELAKKKTVFDSVGYCRWFVDKLEQQWYRNPIRIQDIPGVNLKRIFSSAN